MSGAESRAQLRVELDRATEETIRLSEMISVLRASHAIDDVKLQELAVERGTANLRVLELRDELSAVADDA